MIEMMEETAHKLTPELVQLIEGVDFEKEDFGEVLLRKSSKAIRLVSL